jgi:choline-glycine betaine transporter
MLLATSGLASLLTVLIVLACPLMMIFMMRGMHGGHGAGHAGGRHGGTSDEHPDHSQKTLADLKHERDLLNEEIAQRAEQTVHANH